MKIAFYSTPDFERKAIEEADENTFKLLFLKEALTLQSAAVSEGCGGIVVSARDDASAPVLYALKELGIQFIVSRSSRFDHVDLTTASELGIHIANVPSYSSNAMAENAAAILRSVSILRMTTNMWMNVEQNICF